MTCVFCVNYCQHCLPSPEGIEIGWVIWDLDQVPARGLEQIREWYAEFLVKASAAPRSVWASSAACAMERCPFDVDILAKMHGAVARFEAEAA